MSMVLHQCLVGGDGWVGAKEVSAQCNVWTWPFVVLKYCYGFSLALDSWGAMGGLQFLGFFLWQFSFGVMGSLGVRGLSFLGGKRGCQRLGFLGSGGGCWSMEGFLGTILSSRRMASWRVVGHGLS